MGVMERKIVEAANTVVPAVLALEACGFRLSQEGEYVVAVSEAGTFVAQDPVVLLGLVKLVEIRSWSWRPCDDEIDDVLQRFGWGD